jgi:predicted Rossmann fold flavoprotein
MRSVIVVGGGASGLVAAGTASGLGAEVLLLEKNREVGAKLHISGKGRCNVTNDTTIRGLLNNVPGNPNFLRHAFHHFTPQMTVAFFEELGVATKVERGARVFPVSDDAEDIVRALERFCNRLLVKTWTHAPVARLAMDGGRVVGVELVDRRVLLADAVILATGGASYPGTGSTGDGYRMAEESGHTITPLRASLVPLETVETWIRQVQGLSLRNVTLSAYTPAGKRVFQELGEMLITHVGVSGPLVLSASRHIIDMPGARLEIDLKPGLDEEKLDARLLRDFAEHSNRWFVNSLNELLPRSIIPVIVDLSGIDPITPVHQITRPQRMKLARLLKHLTLTVARPRPISEAIVTAGGVSVREVDSKTMASKVVQGLYFCGEVIDVDAYTGGFNLQIAWSTGRLAGESAAKG